MLLVLLQVIVISLSLLFLMLSSSPCNDASTQSSKLACPFPPLFSWYVYPVHNIINLFIFLLVFGIISFQVDKFWHILDEQK